MATAKRETLNLRIKASERALIDSAAELTGKTRTDFVLEASRRAAEEALLDRTLFLAEPAAHAEFLARLDGPARPNARLKRSLRTPPPWKKK